jgi:hypothetical protein
MSEREELRRLDYQQTLETYRQFTEIRFKLLGFVPAVTAAAVALITKAKLDAWSRAGFAAFGFLATLGLIVYERRNTQLYDGSISRAQHLERMLALPRFERDKKPGLFGSRDSHPRLRLWTLRVQHDLGLALVYASTLGAWGFAAAYRPPDPDPRHHHHLWLPLAIGSGIAAATFVQLRWRNWIKRLVELQKAAGCLRKAVKENRTSSMPAALMKVLRARLDRFWRKAAPRDPSPFCGELDDVLPAVDEQPRSRA